MLLVQDAIIAGNQTVERSALSLIRYFIDYETNRVHVQQMKQLIRRNKHRITTL